MDQAQVALLYVDISMAYIYTHMVYFLHGLIQNSIAVKATVSKTALRNEEWQIESVIKNEIKGKVHQSSP